jgi:uncharacterized membrane protein
MAMYGALDRFLAFSKGKAWPLFAATGIGAFLGVLVTAKSRSASHWLMSVCGGALLGFVAGLFLLGMDSYRGRMGRDHISPLMGLVFVLGLLGLVCLIVFFAVMTMTS